MVGLTNYCNFSTVWLYGTGHTLTKEVPMSISVSLQNFLDYARARKELTELRSRGEIETTLANNALKKLDESPRPK